MAIDSGLHVLLALGACCSPRDDDDDGYNEDIPQRADVIIPREHSAVSRNIGEGHLEGDLVLM